MENFEFDAADFFKAGELVCFVAGQPRPQPRPRYVKGGHVVSTLDEKAQYWKNRVRKAVQCIVLDRAGVTRKNLFGGIGGAVRVDMDFLFSTKDKKKYGMFKTSVPDKDNLEKLVLDAMESAGVFAKGDAQVCAGDITKYWVRKGQEGVRIRISEPVNMLGGACDGLEARKEGLGF